MKQFNVILLGIAILGPSFYGLSTNSYFIQSLINISEPFIYARIAIITVLFAYVFIPSLRLYTTRNLIGVSGILLLSLGLISVGSPSLLGKTDTYILLGDSLIFIEAGILAIVLSAELSAQKSQFMAKTFNYIRSLFTDSVKDVPYTQVANSANQDTNLARYMLNSNKAVPISERLVGGNAVPSKLSL